MKPDGSTSRTRAASGGRRRQCSMRTACPGRDRDRSVVSRSTTTSSALGIADLEERRAGGDHGLALLHDAQHLTRDR